MNKMIRQLNQVINRMDLHRVYPAADKDTLYHLAAKELFALRMDEVKQEAKKARENLSGGELMQRTADRFPEEFDLYLAAVEAV